jgi:hypothetical protein
MLGLARNKKTIFYANWISDAEIMKGGMKTGQYKSTYSDKYAILASVSAGTGQAETQVFGTQITYDKVLAFNHPERGSIPFDENSRIWIDKPTQSEHDYEVVRIAPSLNTPLVAVRRVDVKRP